MSKKTPGQNKGLITTKCTECGNIIDCPAKFEGKTAKCPKCGRRFIVSVYRPESISKGPIKPRVMDVQPVPVEQARSTCGLAIASLALGVIACSTSWVPFLGGLAIPTALIGIFFGIAGGVVSLTTRRTDGYLAGCGIFVCVTAVVVFIFAQGWFAAEVDRRTGPIDNPQAAALAQKEDPTAWHGSDIWATVEVIDGEIYIENQNSYAWSEVCVTVNGDFVYKTSMIPGREISKIPVNWFKDPDGNGGLSLADYDDLDMLIETKSGDCWIR